MYIPWWICHDDIKFSQTRKVKILDIAVNPLAHRMFSNLLLQCLFLCWLFFRIVYMFAVWVMTRIKMRTISHRLISWVSDQCSEMFFCAARASQNLQAPIPCTVLTILESVFVLEGIDFLFLFKTDIVVIYLLIRIWRFAQGWYCYNITDSLFKLFLLLCFHFFLLLKRYRVWRLGQRPLLPGFHGELHNWIQLILFNQKN